MPPTHTVDLSPGGRLYITGNMTYLGGSGAVPPVLQRRPELYDGKPQWTLDGADVFEGAPSNVSWDAIGNQWGFQWAEEVGGAWVSSADVPTPDLVPPGPYDPVTNPHAWRPFTGLTAATGGQPVMFLDRQPPSTVTMPGTSGGSPSAPATVPMEGAGSSEPTYATATVTVIGNPLAAAVQLRVMGIPYSVNLSAPLPGLTIQASVAAQLVTAINANSFAGLLDPTATASGAVITLRAGLPGPGGNLLSLVADTPAFLSLSSANFAGGSGGPTVAVGGTLTKDGTTPVVFPLLSMDSEVDPGWRYSNFGADTLYITPPLTGWEYVLERSEVVTAQVVTGYRWILAAERFVDGSVVESAGWRSPTLPDLHSFSAVTSWAPQGSATGTPILTIPPGAGPAAPATVSMPGTGGGTPGAPATVPI